MQIGGAGSTNFNQLLSDQFTFRNKDYVVGNDGAFMGSTVIIGDTGVLSWAQLWNPVSSGKTLIVDKIKISSVINMGFALYGNETELPAAPSLIGNKLLGGSPSEAVIRGHAGVTLTTTVFASIQRLEAGLTDIDFDYPIIVGEGKGFLAVNAVPNSILNMIFEWREV